MRARTSSRSALPIVAALACGFALGACSKDEDPPPSGERTEEPTPETPKDAPKGPFANYDFEAAQAKLQGAWVLSDGRAWMLDGEVLQVVEAKSEDAAVETLGFSIYSPCQVTYTDEAEGVTTYQTFTFGLGPDGEEVLYMGLGSAGVVAGDKTIVCTSGKVLVLDAEGCRAWSEMFDDWKSEPAECGIEGEGENRTFVTGNTKLSFVGDNALVNSQMAYNISTRHPDFDAAKAALVSAGH